MTVSSTQTLFTGRSVYKHSMWPQALACHLWVSDPFPYKPQVRKVASSLYWTRQSLELLSGVVRKDPTVQQVAFLARNHVSCPVTHRERTEVLVISSLCPAQSHCLLWSCKSIPLLMSSSQSSLSLAQAFPSALCPDDGLFPDVDLELSLEDVWSMQYEEIHSHSATPQIWKPALFTRWQFGREPVMGAINQWSCSRLPFGPCCVQIGRLLPLDRG